MNKLTIEQKVLTGFVFALVVLSLIGGLAYQSAIGYVNASRQATRTHYGIALLEKIFSQLNQAESNQRAYLISGYDRYMSRRRDALAGLNVSLQQLKQLARENPSQLKLLPDLEHKVNARVSLLEDVLKQGREGGFAAAQKMFPLRDGSREMEEIHGVIIAMTEAEDKQLERWISEAEADAGRALIVSVLLLAAMVTSLSLLYLQIRRETGERQRVESELAKSSKLDLAHSWALTLFNSSFDRGHILNGLLSLLAENHPFPASAIYGYDEWRGVFHCESSWGVPGGMKREFKLGEGLVGQAAQAGKLIVLNHIGEEGGIRFEAGLLSFSPVVILICPINYQEQRLGVLVLAANRMVDERYRGFIEKLCIQLGVTLHNLKQYGDLRLMAEQLRQKSEEISAKNAQLEEANRMKSEFMANMSHELRTPLNSIIGFSEAIRDGLAGEPNPKQREYSADILASGQHLLELINEILDLSKVEAGMMTLDLEPVPISQLLASSLSVVKEKAAANRIRLSQEIGEEVNTVFVDARKCKQILYNLLSNAVKFTPDGGQVTLQARKVESRAVPAVRGQERLFNDYLEFSVLDTGIGISQEDIGRLFQPFMQLDGTLARRYEGTGLGLALVKKLAELHGGAVGVESEPGRGSCFTVWLPYRTEAEEKRMDLAPVAGYEWSEAQVEAPLTLVIEDNDRAADLIRLQLEAEGLRVIRAATAEAGLKMVKEQRPDLITLDILLPGMDGWEFMERIKADDETAHIPVVIISIVADASRGASLGAARILQKPIGKDDLINALSELNFIPNGERYRVLVVDDDPKAVELLTLHLDNANYEALRAYSGKEGIEIAQRELPDLIVLDLMMPEVSGFDVVEALKARPDTAQIPVLVVTAKLITEEDRKVLNGYVEKIMSKAEFQGRFINEVHRALKRKT